MNLGVPPLRRDKLDPAARERVLRAMLDRGINPVAALLGVGPTTALAAMAGLPIDSARLDRIVSRLDAATGAP